MKRAGLALLVLVVATGGLALWLASSRKLRDEPTNAAQPVPEPAPDSVLTASPGQAFGATAESSSAQRSPREVVRAQDTAPAPVHGRLICEETGATLDGTQLVLLSSEGDRVSESVRTDEHGQFTSTRAFPAGELRAWVREPKSKMLLGRRVAPFDPGSTEPWVVEIAEAALERALSAGLEEPFEIVGRVKDRSGHAVSSAWVHATTSGNSVSGQTDDRGQFGLHGRSLPEECSLWVETTFIRTEFRRFHVEKRHDVGDIVLPVDQSCSLSGRLATLGGLRLEDLSTGRRISIHPERDSGSFEFTGLAPGAYRLTLIPSEGLLGPVHFDVQAPVSGLELGAPADFGPTRWYTFDVRDADTGGPLESFALTARLQELYRSYRNGNVPAGFERWIVEARGYLPAEGGFFGEFPAGALEATAVVPVRLRRGVGSVRLALDAEAWIDHLYRPLEGVRARRGQLLGLASGEDGLVWEELDGPGELDFELPGWRLREREGRSPERLFFERL